jgi:putative Flp pilus-assembly TadE/G-like protein
VIFAIALVPVLSFVGAAADYSRAVQARSSMQAALGSAALMLSKDLSSGTITTSHVSTKATAYFNALFADTSALLNVTVTATYTASTSMGSTIQLTGDGNFTTTFMKIDFSDARHQRLIDRPVRQGRQCRRQQVLDRFHGLGCRERELQQLALYVPVIMREQRQDLDASQSQYVDRVRGGPRPGL